jgi:hypothetical protein
MLDDGIGIAPLPLSYWEALRRLAEPFEIMKFTLIYDGDLPSTGNHPKAPHVSRIRNEFHDQLADLWESHVVLRQLARTARTYDKPLSDIAAIARHPELPAYDEPITPPPSGWIDLCAPIQVPNSAAYIPLIRKSLNLACALDILFLRHEDPGSLILQGGDIDGRIKTLFDALRIPTEGEERAGGEPTANPLFCLLQSDSLISDLSVRTGRLLGERTKKPHCVRLTIDVTIKVLRVMNENQCLIGG